MDDNLSYCGLICTGCPIYLAGREPDKIKKQKIIDEIIESCKEHYGIVYKREEINGCAGCKSDSIGLFIGCKDCLVRGCALNKQITSCASCDEYPCENLLNTFKIEPGARERLDSLRKQQ